MKRQSIGSILYGCSLLVVGAAQSTPVQSSAATIDLPANLASSVSPEQTDLTSQIIELKELMAATVSREEQAALMRRIDALEQKLFLLQSQNQTSGNSVQPSKPNAASTAPVDPLQAELIAKITELKELMIVTPFPEEQTALMRQIDEIEQHLFQLQSQNLTTGNSVRPIISDPASTLIVDPLQADLIAKIIELKDLMAVTAAPEDQATLMRQIDEIEQHLFQLQSQNQTTGNSVRPIMPDPASTSSADPAQADLIAKIIEIKDLMAVTTAPEDQVALMRRLDELEQKLSLLQSQNQTSGNSVRPIKPDPASTAPGDPAQAELIAKIIEIKDLIAVPATPEEQAVLMRQLDELGQKLFQLQSQNQTSGNSIQPIKPGQNPTDNSYKNVPAAGNLKNGLSIALNKNRQNSANPEEKMVTITWEGGPGIILQMSGSFRDPTWQDVPNSEGKSSIDLPISRSGTFLRAIKR